MNLVIKVSLLELQLSSDIVFIGGNNKRVTNRFVVWQGYERYDCICRDVIMNLVVVSCLDYRATNTPSHADPDRRRSLGVNFVQ